MTQSALIIKSKSNDKNSHSLIELENIKIYAFLSGHESNTKKIYLKAITELFNRWSNLTLKEINSEHIELFLNHYLEGLSNESKAIYKSALSSFFNFLIKDGYLAKNPVSPLKRIKQNKTKFLKTILEHDEVLRMIQKTDNIRNKLIIEFYYVTGLRSEEGLSLRFSDFKIKEEWAYFTVVGKGSKTRKGKISVDLFNRIKALKPASPDSSYLFVQDKRKKGEPLSYTGLYELIKKAGVDAGIKKRVSPHSLRHAHATHALKNGAPLKTLQNTLGHTSATTTMLYTHAANDDFSGEYIHLT